MQSSPVQNTTWYLQRGCLGSFCFGCFRYFLFRLSRQLWHLVAEWKIKRDAGHQYIQLYIEHYLHDHWQIIHITLLLSDKCTVSHCPHDKVFPSVLIVQQIVNLDMARWVTTHCWLRCQKSDIYSPILLLLNHSSTQASLQLSFVELYYKL